MKMLLVFLLLGCSVAQSTILSKCKVWDQLLKVLDPRDRVKLNLASREYQLFIIWSNTFTAAVMRIRLCSCSSFQLIDALIDSSQFGLIMVAIQSSCSSSCVSGRADVRI